MKILITGGTGFIGQWLYRYFSKRDYEVLITSRTQQNEFCIKLNMLNYDHICRILDKHRFDRVFHLAAQSSVKISLDNPFETITDNINTTLNLLKAIHYLGLGDKTNVVVAGTAEVYRKTSSFIKETNVLDPNNPYAISKLTVDYLIRDIAERFDLNATILRIFNITGPHQSDIFVLSSFAKQVAEISSGIKMPVVEVGNLQVQRDFLDVRDVCRAFDLVSQNGSKGEVYNVCSGKGYKIASLLDKLIGISGDEIVVQIDRKRFRANDIPVIKGNYEKLNKDFGWTPTIPILGTLKDMYEWWKLKIK